MLVIVNEVILINVNCPDTETLSPLSPCTCFETTAELVSIHCGGNEKFDLKFMFEELNKILEHGSKHFHSFHLNNTAITELKPNTFSGITFEAIEFLNATQLKIETDAFNGTQNEIQTFYSSNTPLASSSFF